KPAGIMALHDEDRLLRLPAGRAERLRRLLGVALALVVAELLSHVLRSFALRGASALPLRLLHRLAEGSHQVDDLALSLVSRLRQLLSFSLRPDQVEELLPVSIVVFL